MQPVQGGTLLSRLVADLATTFAPQPALAPDTQFRRLIREMLAPYPSELVGRTLGASLRDAIAAAIEPVAIAATREFRFHLLELREVAERAGDSADLSDRYAQALGDLGWWLPPSLGMPDFWRIGRLADEHDRRAVRAEMIALGRSPQMARVVESWMRLPAFRNRRRFILDGLHDHRAGRYRVSIPTLLPQIEGIVVDVFAPRTTSTSVRAIYSDALPDVDAVMGSAMVQAVTILWERLPFDEVAPTSRSLNRHAVLHGRSTGYATEVNSLKVLFALDQLASVVDERHPHTMPA